MKFARTLIIATLPLALAIGCESPATDTGMTSDQAGKLEMANKNAMAAESAAQRAADSANAAAAAAARAARAAEAAAAEARTAGDKADRVFRRGMRK